MTKAIPPISIEKFVSLAQAAIEPLRENFGWAGIKLDGTSENTVKSFSGALARGDEFGMFAEVYEDWSVIEVGRDNVSFGRQMDMASHTKLSGIFTLPNGLTFLAGKISSEWEAPVYALVYHDGEKFRGHIPQTGNTYNTRALAAFGNNRDSDVEVYLEQHGEPPTPTNEEKEDLAQRIDEGDCPIITIDQSGILADLARSFTPA